MFYDNKEITNEELKELRKEMSVAKILKDLSDWQWQEVIRGTVEGLSLTDMQ